MKKRILSIILALTLSLTIAATPVVATGNEDERGVIKYTEIIAPQYEDAKLFSGGFAAVKKDGKWGYIDENNEVVVDFKYDWVNHFSEGYAIVGTLITEEYGAWGTQTYLIAGFIDRDDNFKPFQVISWNSEGTPQLVDWYIPIYNEYSFPQRGVGFNGGYTFIGLGTGESYLFDSSGQQVRIGADYYPIATPMEGMIPVGQGYPYLGYADLDGNMLVELNDLDLFRSRIYDFDGNELEEWTEDVAYNTFITNVTPFNQGLAVVWQSIARMVEDEYEDDYYFDVVYKFGFINTNWQWVIEPQYSGYYYRGYELQQIFSAAEGLASVADDSGLYGAIDKNNKVVIPFIYNELWQYTEGLAAFMLDGEYGYIDPAGNVVIKAQYKAASGFYNGLAAVYDGAKAFLIDRKGNPVEGSDLLDPDNYFTTVDGSSFVYSPEEFVTIKDDGKYGFGKISFLPLLPEPGDMSTYAYEEVVLAIENDLVPTWLQNNYRMDITRRDFASLAVKTVCALLDTEIEDLVLEQTGRSLNDFAQDYPFVDTTSYDVVAAYALKIIDGYPDGTFKPYDRISRQAAAVMLSRAARVLGFDIANPPKSAFNDLGSVGNWAVDGVNFINSIGVMIGSEGAFGPASNYTRQQSFITAYRLLLALVAAG